MLSKVEEDLKTAHLMGEYIRTENGDWRRVIRLLSYGVDEKHAAELEDKFRSDMRDGVIALSKSFDNYKTISQQTITDQKSQIVTLKSALSTIINWSESEDDLFGDPGEYASSVLDRMK